MTTIGDKIKDLSELQKNLGTLAAESFDETKDNFKKLNNVQMYNGQDAEGNDISPPYAASTVRIKKKKGQPYDRVTFKDTGSFYDQYTLKVSGENLELGSAVDYAKYLEQRSGTQIYGLNDTFRPLYTFGPFWSVLKPKIEKQGFKF